MEKFWETSKTLNNCRYLPDIDIQTPDQCFKAGLPTQRDVLKDVLGPLCCPGHPTVSICQPSTAFTCQSIFFYLHQPALPIIIMSAGWNTACKRMPDINHAKLFECIRRPFYFEENLFFGGRRRNAPVNDNNKLFQIWGPLGQSVPPRGFRF